MTSTASVSPWPPVLLWVLPPRHRLSRRPEIAYLNAGLSQREVDRSRVRGRALEMVDAALCRYGRVASGDDERLIDKAQELINNGEVRRRVSAGTTSEAGQ